MAPLTLRLLLSLITGLAGGVHTAPLPADSLAPDLVQIAFALGLMIATLAHANRWLGVRTVCTWLSVACVAWVLGLHTAERALRPTLRIVLEQRAEILATAPVVAEGILLRDAAVTATGVVMRLAVERLWIGLAPQAVAGGVSVVVVGELAPGLHAEWTEGRRVRAPMQLRRPAVYLNEGVPDFERALALRGVTLVGTIKSGALVELVARGAVWQEWAARMRARMRRALAAHLSPGAAAVAIAILIGDRAALAADVERRLQEAGTYHVLAISGGNIAILAGAVIGVLALAGWRGRGAALNAVAHLVEASNQIGDLNDWSQVMWENVTRIWEKSRYEKGRSVGGRDFVHILDDVKDHTADRRKGLDYLIAPYQRTDLPGWRKKLNERINQYAAANKVQVRGLDEKRLED